MNHVELCIDHAATVRDAMRQLDHTSKKILFVMEGQSLRGTLTDGDIRRFLLSGGKMDASAADAAHRHPKAAKSAKGARTLLVSGGGRLMAVPVVDDAGTLLDIVLEADSQSSRCCQIIVTYDSDKRAFYADMGETRELSYINGQVLLMRLELQNRDILQVGDIKLMFIPLCGPDFAWQETENKLTDKEA